MTMLLAVVVLSFALYYLPALFGWTGVLVGVGVMVAIEAVRKVADR